MIGHHYKAPECVSRAIKMSECLHYNLPALRIVERTIAISSIEITFHPFERAGYIQLLHFSESLSYRYGE